MNCRIEEWETIKGEMSPRRVANALLLGWAVKYDTELKGWYADAMEFYERQIQRKETVEQGAFPLLATESDHVLRSAA